MQLLTQLRSSNPPTDEIFDAIFPAALKAAAEFHFTPLPVALKASAFLSNKSKINILDIGSGAGKFCLIGAATTSAHYTGVEVREKLVDVSKKLKTEFKLDNLKFIASNITDIDFSKYQAFYHFNAFYENIYNSGDLDDSILLDKKLYRKYSQFVKEQLNDMPIGTRLATYFSYGDEIPESYQVVSKDFDGKLVLRKKIA